MEVLTYPSNSPESSHVLETCMDPTPRRRRTLYTLYVPRHVPIPLRTKVNEETINMENLGIITKVEQYTPWCTCCSDMVVVPKESGNVRICVDLKPLNESVLREV